MFANVSMAGTGAVITVLVMLFKLLGIEVAEADVQKIVEGIVALVGISTLVLGQLRRKDLSYGLFRK